MKLTPKEGAELAGGSDAVRMVSPYLTAKEAAAYLRISYSTFRKKAKFIRRAVKTNRYRVADLDAFAQGEK